MKMRGYLWVIFALSLLISIPGFASEVRGSFWSYNNAQIPSGAAIKVYCGNFYKSAMIQPNGSYSVRGLPPSRGCTYQIEYPDGSMSKPMAFNSGSGVVQINGELRKYKNIILVISK